LSRTVAFVMITLLLALLGIKVGYDISHGVTITYDINGKEHTITIKSIEACIKTTLLFCTPALALGILLTDIIDIKVKPLLLIIILLRFSDMTKVYFWDIILLFILILTFYVAHLYFMIVKGKWNTRKILSALVVTPSLFTLTVVLVMMYI